MYIYVRTGIYLYLYLYLFLCNLVIRICAHVQRRVAARGAAAQLQVRLRRRHAHHQRGRAGRILPWFAGVCLIQK